MWFFNMILDLDIFFSKKFFNKQGLNYTSISNNSFFLHKNIFFSSFFVDMSGFYKNYLCAFVFSREGFLFKPFILLFKPFKFFGSDNNWVFREFNEFFVDCFLGLSDKRNILLDYRLQEKPLSKNFTGFFEVNFNPVVMDVACSRSSFVEL